MVCAPFWHIHPLPRIDLTMKKGTKLYSILKFKCPYCHEGDFFVHPNPYRLKSVGDVRTECNKCGRSYQKEPGFFQGAMYVSYGMGVALFIGTFTLAWLIDPEASAFFYAAVVVISNLVLAPLLFALSKIVYANIFMHYKGAEPIEHE